MQITVIYGTERKGRSTTYHLAQQVVQTLKGTDDVFEFFLPKAMHHFCSGCSQCFEGHQDKCPAAEQLVPIREAMSRSELIIFTAPVYVYHVPGQLKAFLDHFGWQWMVHQFNGEMMNKQALIISTAAGAGMKSTIKDVKDNMDFWGIARVHTYGKALFAANWTDLDAKKQAQMLAEMTKLANKIQRRAIHLTPRLKVKAMFYGCRVLQKKIGINAVDREHWKHNGWLEKEKPWNK